MNRKERALYRKTLLYECRRVGKALRVLGAAIVRALAPVLKPMADWLERTIRRVVK
jgi:hypothetical protein